MMPDRDQIDPHAPVAIRALVPVARPPSLARAHGRVIARGIAALVRKIPRALAYPWTWPRDEGEAFLKVGLGCLGMIATAVVGGLYVQNVALFVLIFVSPWLPWFGRALRWVARGIRAEASLALAALRASYALALKTELTRQLAAKSVDSPADP